MPHLNWILHQLDHGILSDNEEAIRFLLDLLLKNPEFKNFIKQLSNETVEAGITFTRTVINETVEIIKENEELASQLAKLATKVVVREIATNRLLAKATINFATLLPAAVSRRLPSNVHFNVVLLAIDGAQFGLEYFEYTEAGKNIGLYGNIAIGAVMGSIKAGIAGFAIGAILGFGVWVIGEAVSKGIDKTFS